MGSIVRRDGKFRAMVRKAGHDSVSRTFSTMKDAKLWVAETELALAKATVTDPRVTVDALLDAYVRDVAPRRGMADTHLTHDMPALRRRVVGLRLADLTGRGLIDWVLALDMHPSSRRWFVWMLFGLLRQAHMHMGVSVPWDDLRRAREVLKDAGAILETGERDRRITDDEFEAIVDAMPKGSKIRPLVRFLLLTCMRVGEATRITWPDVDEAARTVLIRDRKHPREKLGNNQRVPLLAGSIDVMKAHRTRDVRCWPTKPDYASDVFRVAAKDAGVEGVVLHDLRHEGISRMFEAGFSIPEVALVSGHRDWKQLRRYTNLRAEHLHAREAAMKKAG